MAVVITRISPLSPKPHLLFFFSSSPAQPFAYYFSAPNNSFILLRTHKKKMATLQSLVFSTKISHRSPGPPSLPGLATGSLHCVHSSFTSQSLHMFQSRGNASKQNSRVSRLTVMMVKPTIQFIQGTDELTVPDVKLTKSRDGTNGMAIFKFDEPSVFDSSGEVGDITGMYLIDEEGVLQSVDVNAKFVNGKPAGIEAKYIMRTPRDWDRFMRFMERYANQNGLQFIKK